MSTYPTSWKMEEGLYDNHDFFDDTICDYYMSLKDQWLVSLEPYQRATRNPTNIALFLGIFKHAPHNPSSPTKSKEEIREAITLSKVISTIVPIKRTAPHKYKACCVFHDDSTPSLVIDDKRGLFFCHGCSVGGDVFTFLMKVNKCSFKEAILLVEKYI